MPEPIYLEVPSGNEVTASRSVAPARSARFGTSHRSRAGAGVFTRSRTSSWVMAARPQTLGLSTTPVIVGAALSWAVEREVNLAAVVAAFLGSVLIQIGTNLHNDAADYKRGGDGPDRVGAPRATASGLLSAAAVTRGAAACFAAAAAIGAYLIWLGGWPIALLGAASLLSGWAYTGGARPIAYTPFGEAFVVVFFGIAAVCGTYWLCTGQMTAVAVEVGVAVGLLTAAVLLVNNHRDAKADYRVGRRTLAIVCGPSLTRCVYAGLLIVPFFLLGAIAAALPNGHAWPALLALPMAVVMVYRFAAEPAGPGFNRILVQTARLQHLFGLLLAAGLVL